MEIAELAVSVISAALSACAIVLIVRRWKK